MKQSLCRVPSPLLLAVTDLLSLSKDLPTLDISCKWNHIVYVFFHVWLILLKTMLSYCSLYQYYIPVCGQLILHCVAIPHLK